MPHMIRLPLKVDPIMGNGGKRQKLKSPFQVVNSYVPNYNPVAENAPFVCKRSILLIQNDFNL